MICPHYLDVDSSGRRGYRNNSLVLMGLIASSIGPRRKVVITRSTEKPFSKRKKGCQSFLISFAFLKQPSQKVNMAFESEYQLEGVAATRVASDKIDATFRSTSIGKSRLFLLSGAQYARIWRREMVMPRYTSRERTVTPRV